MDKVVEQVDVAEEQLLMDPMEARMLELHLDKEYKINIYNHLILKTGFLVQQYNLMDLTVMVLDMQLAHTQAAEAVEQEELAAADTIMEETVFYCHGMDKDMVQAEEQQGIHQMLALAQEVTVGGMLDLEQDVLQRQPTMLKKMGLLEL